MFSNSFEINKKGFSLVEVLIVMFIAAVVFVSFYSVSTIGTKYIIESKNRLGAVALANEKMEIIRNLSYANAGIQGGPVSGNILQNEDVVANGKSFHIYTLIKYEDDPMDGIYPADAVPNDYKSIKVVVSWKDSNGQTKEVVSVSRFVPPGLETSVGGALLAINVKGSDGVPVPQADVHIINNSLVPAINFTIKTDDDGHIMLPAALPALNSYEISVSKSGYKSVATAYPNGSIVSPMYSTASVILGSLNMYDFILDKSANLTVKTITPQGNPVASMSYIISGGMVLGRDASSADVMSLAATPGSTNASGEKKYPSISSGNYKIVMDANAQYDFIDYDPTSNVALTPDSDLTYNIYAVDKVVSSLFVKVVDSSSVPIVGAKITLTDGGGTDIFTEKLTNAKGTLFYPDSSAPLVAGNYTLKVEADGYAIETKTININVLTKEDIILVAN